MRNLLSVVLPAAMLWMAPAHATPLADWRGSIAQVRIAAESDAPKAYRDAQRLDAAIPSNSTPADRAKILNLLARIEIYLALTDAAARHAEAALELAKQNGDKLGQVEADLTLALTSVNQGRIDVLVAVTTHCMTVLDGIDRPDLVAEAMLRTGTMYGRIGEFDTSMTMPMQAMDMAERSRNPTALMYAHEGMAIALWQTGQWAETMKHYEQMREYARAANSPIHVAEATLGIGNALTEQHKLREGETHLREAIAFYRAFKGPFYIAHGLNTLAANLKRQGRHAEAQALVNEVIDIYQTRGNRIGLWWAISGRSGDYQADGRLAEAEADARHAYAIGRELDTPFYRSRSARRLAAVLAARGDHGHAYALSVEAAELTEKADKERASARMLDLAQRYRTEAKQREIEELERRNEQQAEAQRSLWSFLAASIAILAVTAYLLLRLRRSHRLIEAANARLREKQQEIQTLNINLEQRVQARTADLRQQARYLRTLIDMLPMWAWFKDTESRYLVTNQAHAKAAGYSPEEMVGKSDYDFAPQALARSQQADDAEVMASRQRKTTEEYLPDGSVSRWMETYKAAVTDEDGTLLGTVGVARDVSERKAAEDARNAALAQAERLAELRSRFLAQMSHELRTPLNGILGYAQLLGQDPRLDERQSAGLAVIEQCGEQLLTLVNDILDIAKIEAGRLDMQPSHVPLQPFLRGITDIVGVRAERKGLVFICELGAHLPEAIHVDERLLRQALLNLLANAVKFTDRGHVTLHVAREVPNRLRFTVEDTGIGIAADQLDLIFRPFEQAGEASRRVDGTGLGLAISRQFVSRMGGEIRVSSTPGKGSVFWFELETPDASPQSEVRTNKRLVSGYEGLPRRILAVDDMPESRELMAALLEPLGFEVVQACDGLDALCTAESLRPDLILLDTVMPGMDGYETTRRLRAMAAFAETPIISVSASASAQDRENAIAVGATDFLPKPLRLDVLLDRIGALLRLAWIYGEPSAHAASSADDDALAPPPPEHMETLLHLALQGNMRDILDHADALLQMDTRYHPFAYRLRRLASGYQSKAILNLVERYLNRSSVR